MAERPGQHRLGEVEAPAAVRGQRRLESLDQSVVVEAHPPLGVEAVALAAHGEVLGAVQPEPDRAAGQDAAESRDRGEAVRLHLLAAEPATHAQALHGHLVAVQAEHVGHDLLRLRGMLGAALHEDLPALVDQRQGAVRLEVEVLLSGELELSAEHVRGRLDPGSHVTALDRRLGALEGVRRDRVLDVDQRRQRLQVEHHGRSTEPGRFECLAQHPADGVAVEADLVREQRLVVLDPGVVDARHVGGGEHAHDPRYVVRRGHVEARDPGPGHRGLHGPGVQAVLGPGDEVVGVERLARDVQGRRLVRDRAADPIVAGSVSGRCERWLMPGLLPGAGRAASAATGRASPRGSSHWPGGRRSVCPRRPAPRRPAGPSRRSMAARSGRPPCPGADRGGRDTAEPDRGA